MVLSCDTAICPERGDLSLGHPTWEALLQLFQLRRVAAVVSGPPCETFTEARYNQPQPLEVAKRWPRPLRSWARLMGLEGLSMKELRQTKQGTAFYLQSMIALIWMVIGGGFYVCEHPAKPRLSWRPSIWTSPLVQLYLKIPEVKLWTIEQWRWGCETPKPTGLLSVRMPHLGRILHDRQLPGLTRPTGAAIGRDPTTGQFYTHALKEYPGQLCFALAESILDALVLQRGRSATSCPSEEAVPSSLRSFVNDLAAVSKVIRSDAPICADYQGG